MRRTTEPYVKGARAFVAYATDYFRKMRNIDERVKDDDVMMPCPCQRCVNRLERTSRR